MFLSLVMYDARVAMPRVSIIPAFKAGAYIAETLRSAQEQTYHDWEVVLGNDGSSDGTLTIAVVPSAENSGPAVARNGAMATFGV